MYNFLRRADIVLNAYGAERVAIHNEMDRKQAELVEKQKMPILAEQMDHGDSVNANWVISASMQAGTVYYSIMNKKLDYAIDSGFMVSKWEYLHSKFNYYGNNPVKVKFGKKENVYTNSITFKDEDTTFKVNVFPYNYVLGNFDLGATYSRMRFLITVPNTIPCFITKEQLGKLSKIGSATGFKTVVLEIKEGKLLAKCGAKTQSSDMGELIVCPVPPNTIDYIVGEFDIDKICNLKIFGEDTVKFNINAVCLYFQRETDEYDERLMLVGKNCEDMNVAPKNM